MMQVRQVREDELDAMVVIMCRAFGLPIAPARNLFFDDPYFDLRHKRVLTLDGCLVSCLTLASAAIRFGAAVVPLMGIAGVATRPEDQRRGYATRLLLDTVADLASGDVGLVALVADTPGFYERLGWRPCGRQARLRFAAGPVAVAYAGPRPRKARETDAPWIARIHAGVTGTRDGSAERDEKRWRYLLRFVQQSWVWPARGLPQGYVLFESRPDPPGALVRVIEIAATSDEARRRLWAHAARHAGTGDLLWVTESSLCPGELPPGATPGMQADIQRGVMYRIASFHAALRSLTPNFADWRGCLRLRCTDPLLGRTTVCELHGRSDGIEVTEVDSARADVEGDQASWVRVLTGDASLTDAAHSGLLRAGDGAVAALGPRLPQRDLHLPPADHF
ncbi:MAG TPA: GNAT family N-acetyltransferase [Chthonomonadales bacterium]|nr:GNAT family N-acetyltransferase [Chthonomonadales bacterium]